jgi:hypothetical protein
MPAVVVAAVGAAAIAEVIGIGATASAAELMLFPSAIDKAVKSEIFDSAGKRVLQGDPQSCAYALLEQPQTSLVPGRIALRAHLVAQLGVSLSGECTGTGDAFWVTVSGRPVMQGDLLTIDHLSLDEGKPAYRGLLEGLLSNHIADALKIDLRKELQALLRNAGPYSTRLPQLTVLSVETSPAGVRISFDFKLEAR